MRPAVVLDMKRNAIREAVGRFRTANPRVFGCVVWKTVQEWLPALLRQLSAVRQDADDKDRNDYGMEA